MPVTSAPYGAGRYKGRLRPAVLAGILVLVPALAGCTADGGSSPAATVASVPASGGTMPDAPATSAPLETTQSSNKAPVYWIGRSGGNIFLYREFRDVPEQENPVTRALRAMMSEKPLDPDFFTPWQNPDKLATSISGKDVITVDVSSDAFNSNLDADMAARAIQQLIYTATAAAASSGLIDAGQQIRVRILVDGHTDYVAFGKIQLGSLMTRAAGLVAPVWIIDPQENTEVPAGSVKITGRSTSPGSKLHWQILQSTDGGSKAPFLTGETTAATDPAQAGAFTVALNLPVGDYELRVAQAGQDGQPDRNEDTRSFKVR
ncbi:GerMN domain-containing protein [Pseudarthrobacter enclensis]|uniref:Spore germination protein GerM n=1 Tax=Pseudarthrobacter enclensis TaxID=993070 RepID=A0ABT9RZ25_9MICC|nr:GerMN domain-containing protein [Pseudarthrobacter enclensis]MDP9890505.1 spore germination protein GerM [Pseudarthrobacter enclensis]